MATKSADTRTPSRGRPFAKGGDERQGRGPKKGEGGAPLVAMRARYAKLAQSEKTRKYLERCLSGEEGGKVFVMALKEVNDRTYGKAPAQLQVSGVEGGPPVIFVEKRAK